MRITFGLLVVIVVIIAIVFVFIGIIFGVVSDSMCKEKCEERGALYHSIKNSGNWAIDDWCTCYYQNKTETFKLG
ncbi:MAG: hypothetical protein KKF56_05165 [Nanoarchaeota archaeon]|nr:hypothetical protein [Nanoarchaeota archaeon]